MIQEADPTRVREVKITDLMAVAKACRKGNATHHHGQGGFIYPSKYFISHGSMAQSGLWENSAQIGGNNTIQELCHSTVWGWVSGVRLFEGIESLHLRGHSVFLWLLYPSKWGHQAPSERWNLLTQRHSNTAVRSSQVSDGAIPHASHRLDALYLVTVMQHTLYLSETGTNGKYISVN